MSSVPSFAVLYDVTPALLRGDGAALSDILMWPSILGNAFVGALSTLTGNLRVALLFASPLFIVGGVMLLYAGRTYVRAVEEVVIDAKHWARQRRNAIS